ncbi:M10 family metallopeptidase C-terminal domain-containing protein [Reyranella sp.]|uniref:M10 family metallopeptidase C-terminal domain-containing protein n=1 Tax=Reyranella sp. TaxID=1929291 RepID=UPI0027238B1B|nr:M10 family metallopeptidase C-terminal domain-containing protein [Reyranella sp.]MDO8976781.1 M10 family metallopeptidase C-terminal domain-containing protein [Reyranella sp.]
MPGTATTIFIDGTPTDGSDPWIDSLVAGGAWTDGNGGPVTIQWTAFQGTMDGQNSYSWTALALNGLREAMSLWESVANIDFVEVTSATDADVRFWWGTQAQAGGPNVLGWSDLPGYSSSEVLDILFNAPNLAMSGVLGKGSLGLVTMVHEIGHLLGLAHPHDGGPGWDRTTFPGVNQGDEHAEGTGSLNQGIYTTMSYTFGWPDLLPGHTSESYGLQYGPMALDIAAIQAIYGANSSYASGNNVYQLPTTNGFNTAWSTIWDTGGIDTISNAGSSGNSTIDLRVISPSEISQWDPRVSYGYTSSGFVVAGGYTIANGVVVENAIGGSGNDRLIGNSSDNMLDGGGGADSLSGGAGNDRLVIRDLMFELANGGSGIDTLVLAGGSATLNLSDPVVKAKLVGIERIDLTGTGDNALVVSQASGLGGVGTYEDGSRVLVVEGNAGDKVWLAEPGWTQVGSFTDTAGTFDRWVLGDTELHVEQDVSAQQVLASSTVLLSSLNGSNGFKLSGGLANHYSGSSVASAGDVNGDGFDDILIGDRRADIGAYDTGAAYVVFGKASGFAADIPLSTLNGSNGFRLSGVAANDRSGYSVASAGDLNGDGFADLIIGATQADPGGNNSGATYVVFGKATGFAADINLGTLNGSNGFRLNGVAAGDYSGHSVASAGDFNNDGFDDLIVGAWGADPQGADSGTAYIVFGKASGFAASVNLSALTASTGFKLTGASEYDQAGASVASAGDVNGDGYDDVIIGARNAFTTGDQAGASYVVFGKASGIPSSLDLSALNGSNGFRLNGVSTSDYSGQSVASAGDLNGDGFGDLIIGANGADPNGAASGASYVVFGKASGFAANINLSALNGTNGFVLQGASEFDNSGISVASAGDINGDGFADLLVGAAWADVNGTPVGISYVLFGKVSGFAASTNLATLDGLSGFRVVGTETYGSSGTSVASAGDVNGDGYDDMIIGSEAGAGGTTYVVFGGPYGASGAPVTTTGTTAAEILMGGRGKDVLTGGGGGDVFHAGAGDDRLIVKDLTFRLADGGTGVDTLALGGTGLSLDLTKLLVAGKLEGIGRIDLSGTGNNTLIVNQLSILGGIGATMDGKHILTVERNYGDIVQFSEAAWAKTGSFSNAAGAFDRWVLGNAEVHVKQASAPPGSGVTINGTAGNDIISTTETVAGQPKATALGDIIDGKAGVDTMSGGDGDDAYYVYETGDKVIEAAGAGIDTVYSYVSYTLSANVENMVLLGGATNATGNELNNILTGTAYSNVLIGGGGTDTLIGGLGDDTYEIDDVTDIVVENAAAGTDTIRVSFSYVLDGINVENLTLTGSANINGTGDAFDNVLRGNSGNNRLEGGLGNDTLIGIGGIDTLIGGLGDDTYEIDGASDVIVENASEGIDTVRTFFGGNHVLGANFENLVLTGGGNGTGNDHDNVLTGNDGNNRLEGGAGNDTLITNGGLDTLIGGTGDDTYILRYYDDATIVEKAGEGIDTVRTISSVRLGANLENLELVGTAAVLGYGNDAANVVTGNAAANDLKGFAGDDTLVANGGNDTLDGGTGVDTMIGGEGDDTYYVDDAADVVVEAVGEGTDTVHVASSYTLGANVEKLVLTGTASVNGTGNDLNNTITGNSGNNLLDGAGGFDRLIGGRGNDTYYIGRPLNGAIDAVTELANEGYDTVHIEASLMNWIANVEHVILIGAVNYNAYGDAQNNTITGNAGSNQLIGYDGNDTLDGGAGADSLYGVGGNDTYIVDDIGDIVFESPGDGNDTVRASVSFTLSSNVETLVLTGAGNIDGTGNELSNSLFGNAGDNKLDGKEGADGMSGGAGNDTYVVDNVSDVVSEEVDGGTDTVLSSVTYTLHQNVEILTLTGASAINGTGNGLDNWLTGNAGINTLAGAGGNDTYVIDSLVDVVFEKAGEGTDTVRSSVSHALAANVENLVLTGVANIDGTGNILGNVLTGNDGNNTLDGGAGADTMAGGLGDDTYVVDNAGDLVTELAGAGTDTVLASINWTLGAALERLTLTGVDNLAGTGNELANVMTGNAGNNLLDGGAAADTMAGGLGDDTYVVDVAGDVVTEIADQGTDTVNAWLGWTLGANLEQLRLMGTADLNGTGNGLNNALFGNAGKNVLNGGAGADTMAGGQGDDTYVVDQSGDVVVEAAGGGTDLVQSSAGSYQLGANVENLVLTGTGAINGTGNELANVLTGNVGNNILDGGAGADTMAGGTGDDTYVVDNAGDVVTEEAGGGIDTVLSSITWTLAANVERLTLSGTADLNGTGNALANVLTGNAGKNVLDGGAGADTMAGGLGDDTYVVDAVGDVVIENAGEGTDTVEAWLGWTLGANLEQLKLLGTADIDGTGNSLNNVLTGNAGKNVLNGGAGADTMTGGSGDDTYVVDNVGDVVVETANGGIDTVLSSVTWMLGLGVENLTLTRSGDIGGTGNALRNILTGNGGANLLDGGAGADTMAGGLGNDFYVVDNAGDVVTELAGGGIDTVRASVSHTLSDHVEKLVLLGSGHLRGTGNALANTLTGNDGNNVLDGQAGADTMAGGRGNDSYIVDNAGDVLGEGEGAGTDTVQSSVTWRLKDNFENLVLTGSADIDGSGNELANVLTGNDGNNLLDGGAGADTMAGGLGDDIYVVNAASDRISEAAGQGTDTVRAWATYRLQDNLETLVLMGNAALNGTGNGADNVILGNGGRNVLDGGAGADRMEGGAGNDTYVVDDAGDLVNESGGGIDEVRSWVSYTLTANVETLTLLGTGDLDGTGNGLANTLNGNGGANRLDGGSGADTMYGGAGDDTYVVDAPGDRVIERAGNGYDTVLSSVSHTLSAEVEKLVLSGSAAVDGGGNGAANVLIGNGANNVLDGGLGADAMEGGEGDDTYVVDNAGDVVTELANGGTDLVRSGVSHTLAAHVENLTLTGKANIAATGNELANILTGNAGRNVLDGGLGADVLAGGGGGDTFRFSTALGLDNIDRILAFNHNADTIQLDHAVFAALGAGALAVGAFNLGPVATQADDRILFDAASKSLSYDADGLGGVDAVRFATIDTLQGGLDHTDFLIV